jgi:sphinganine-1-phosphate aldolase
MSLTELAQEALSHLPAGAARRIEAGLRRIGPARRLIEQQYETVVGELESHVHPYAGKHEAFATIPEKGLTREHVLAEVRAMAEKEAPKWQEGYVSGGIYHGDAEHIGFLHDVYAAHSQTNPLHADLFPSIVKMEAEIVSMTASMLGGEGFACGTVTSGGTESILLAMKTYRDRAHAEGNTKPAMVVPSSAHAAFDKASSYFGIEKITVPVGSDFKADPRAMSRAVTRSTVVMVGSAPCFPHGVVDPIPELAAIAQKRGIGFHTDACLGGFVLPWARELGYDVQPFDFSVPGVTSMSADTHKYGYALKGTSVVLYRDEELRRFQYYVTTEWPGGMYFSPTLAGSRPGGLSATCWAAMITMGREGYRNAAKAILDTAATIKAGIKAIPELEVLGDPLFVIAFASQSLNVYNVMDAMSRRGWSLNGLHKPACVHVCVTLRHTQPGVADRFLTDLRASVEEAKASKNGKGGMAPIYGLGATLPFRGIVGELLRRYIDALYRVR